MMFPPAGFQDLANDIQLEDKDRLLPFARALSLGGPSSEPSAGCQALSGQLVFSLGPDTEPAFLRAMLTHWNPEWKRLKMCTRASQSPFCLPRQCPRRASPAP